MITWIQGYIYSVLPVQECTHLDTNPLVYSLQGMSDIWGPRVSKMSDFFEYFLLGNYLILDTLAPITTTSST